MDIVEEVLLETVMGDLTRQHLRSRRWGRKSQAGNSNIQLRRGKKGAPLNTAGYRELSQHEKKCQGSSGGVVWWQNAGCPSTPINQLPRTIIPHFHFKGPDQTKACILLGRKKIAKYAAN